MDEFLLQYCCIIPSWHNAILSISRRAILDSVDATCVLFICRRLHRWAAASRVSFLACFFCVSFLKLLRSITIPWQQRWWWQPGAFFMFQRFPVIVQRFNCSVLLHDSLFCAEISQTTNSHFKSVIVSNF